MTTPYRRWPDINRVLVAFMESIVGTGHVAIETPPDLQQKLPFIRVMRIGGSSDKLNDFTTFDVDVFSDRYDTGEELAERARQLLTATPPPSNLLDRIDCQSSPDELPWADEGIRRFGATYLSVARRSVLVT